MQEKRHDRVVEMRLCFFLGKVGDYNVSFVETRMCRSTINGEKYILVKADGDINANGIILENREGEKDEEEDD